MGTSIVHLTTADPCRAVIAPGTERRAEQRGQPCSPSQGHRLATKAAGKTSQGGQAQALLWEALLLLQPPGTARQSAPVPHQYRGRLGQPPRKPPSSCHEVYRPVPEGPLVKYS